MPPEGWALAKKHDSWGDDGFKSPEGKWQAEAPPGSKAVGAIALADGIKNNGALAILDMSDNRIPDNQESNLKSICSSKSIDLKL